MTIAAVFGLCQAAHAQPSSGFWKYFRPKVPIKSGSSTPVKTPSTSPTSTIGISPVTIQPEVLYRQQFLVEASLADLQEPEHDWTQVYPLVNEFIQEWYTKFEYTPSFPAPEGRTVNVCVNEIVDFVPFVPVSDPGNVPGVGDARTVNPIYLRATFPRILLQNGPLKDVGGSQIFQRVVATFKPNEGAGLIANATSMTPEMRVTTVSKDSEKIVLKLQTNFVSLEGVQSAFLDTGLITVKPVDGGSRGSFTAQVWRDDLGEWQSQASVKTRARDNFGRYLEINIPTVWFTDPNGVFHIPALGGTGGGSFEGQAVVQASAADYVCYDHQNQNPYRPFSDVAPGGEIRTAAATLRLRLDSGGADNMRFSGEYTFPNDQVSPTHMKFNFPNLTFRLQSLTGEE